MSWESVLALVVAVLIAYGVLLWIGTIVWVYRDVHERTRDTWSQWVSLALVVLFNIPGLILYLVLRPGETLAEAYERRLEAEALMHELPESRSCPTCARATQDDFLLCPFCRTKLRESCASCGRLLELGWAACPYCGAQGPQASVAATAGMVAGPAPRAGAPAPVPSEPAEAGAPASAAATANPPWPQS